MAKLYYVDRDGKGMLRACLGLNELSSVMEEDSPTLMGASLADAWHQGCHSAVLEVLPDEASANWRKGFYRFQNAPLEFENLLSKSLAS